MMDMSVQPLATIPGGSCLKEYKILPNKREILTRESAGNMALWSVLFVSGRGLSGSGSGRVTAVMWTLRVEGRRGEGMVSLMPCECGEVGVAVSKRVLRVL